MAPDPRGPAIEVDPAKWGGTKYHEPPRTDPRHLAALERIRGIVDSMPRAFDVQDIKAVLAEVLGEFIYRARKPCP